jgi:AmiR/NasT family two-component response regulator
VGGTTHDRETEHLRVLIANERADRLALVAPIVVALGHEVIAKEIDASDVGAVTARERPDVALVGLGECSEHALALIDKIVREAACPVIVLLRAPDRASIREASKGGVLPTSTMPTSITGRARSTIVLRRFAEFHDLEGQSRSANRKLIDLAGAVVDGHRLLPKNPHASPEP